MSEWGYCSKCEKRYLIGEDGFEHVCPTVVERREENTGGRTNVPYTLEILSDGTERAVLHNPPESLRVSKKQRRTEEPW